MANDPEETGPDRKLVALNEPQEVLAWTKSLGCTEAQLRDAAPAVGNSAEAVHFRLKKQ